MFHGRTVGGVLQGLGFRFYLMPNRQKRYFLGVCGCYTTYYTSIDKGSC